MLFPDKKNGTKSRGNKKIRDKRFEIIACLIGMPRSSLSEIHTFNNAVKETALRYSLHPRTVKRWLKRYEEASGDVDALLPNYKGRQMSPEFNRVKHKVMMFAKQVRLANPVITVLQLIREIEAQFPELEGQIKRPTLQHYLQQIECSKRIVKMDSELRDRGFFNRFEHCKVLDFVQGDIKYGPKCLDENGKLVQTYIVVWIDDRSRYVLSMGVFTKQDQHVIHTTLRDLLSRFGRVGALYTDNGKVYKSAALQLACKILQIVLKHAKVRSPESKGKVEAFNRTLDQLLNSANSYTNPMKLSVFTKLAEDWRDRYNNTVHSALNKRTPHEVFYGSWSPETMQAIDPTVLEQAFLTTEMRKVRKDGSIQYKGIFYKILIDKAKPLSEIEIAVERNGKEIAVSLFNDRFDLVPLEVMTMDAKPNRIPERAAGLKACNLPEPDPEFKGFGIKPMLVNYLKQRGIKRSDYSSERFHAAAAAFEQTGSFEQAIEVLQAEVPAPAADDSDECGYSFMKADSTNNDDNED